MVFCNWFIHKCNEDPNFPKFVIWTDESYISSDGIFNRHNKHQWADNNPHATATSQRQGRFGFSVWCGLINSQLIGPHFFRNNLTSASYLNILEIYLPPYLENIPLAHDGRIYFQQDGAPAHNARRTTEYLDQVFPEKWIGRFIYLYFLFSIKCMRFQVQMDPFVGQLGPATLRRPIFGFGDI